MEWSAAPSLEETLGSLGLGRLLHARLSRKFIFSRHPAV